MSREQRIAWVYVYPNGMVAVCDEDGHQIPRYQGEVDKVWEAINRDAPPGAIFKGRDREPTTE